MKITLCFLVGLLFIAQSAYAGDLANQFAVGMAKGMAAQVNQAYTGYPSQMYLNDLQQQELMRQQIEAQRLIATQQMYQNQLLQQQLQMQRQQQDQQIIRDQQRLFNGR